MGLMPSEVIIITIKKNTHQLLYSVFRVKLSLHRNPTFHLDSLGAPEPGPVAYFHTSTSMPLSEEERPNWLFGFGKIKPTIDTHLPNVHGFLILLKFCCTAVDLVHHSCLQSFPRSRKRVIDAYLPLSFQRNVANLFFFLLWRNSTATKFQTPQKKEKRLTLFYSVVLTAAELQTTVHPFCFFNKNAMKQVAHE